MTVRGYNSGGGNEAGADVAMGGSASSVWWGKDHTGEEVMSPTVEQNQLISETQHTITFTGAQQSLRVAYSGGERTEDTHYMDCDM
ncbi:hypothetical protein Tco_1501020 [Tanacetum coccineum]